MYGRINIKYLEIDSTFLFFDKMNCMFGRPDLYTGRICSALFIAPFDPLLISDHHVFRLGGRGVSILARNTLNSVSLNNFGSVGDSVECCAIRMWGSLGQSDSHLNIFGLYRPPRGSIIEFINFFGR